MRLGILALLVLAMAVALMLAVRSATTTSAPPPAPPPRPSVAREPVTVQPGEDVATPRPRVALPSPSLPPPAAPRPGAPAPAAPAASDREDPALAAWRARASERDYAYWDMKLNMLRKIRACVGDKMQTLGAAEVGFHFKKQDGVWLADRAVLRDPDDEERAKMGAVEFRGADRALAERCIGEAFAGTTMPITGGTEELEQYEVRGQIMFPTTADRAWQETGVSP
jgi:hypothetical protein